MQIPKVKSHALWSFFLLLTLAIQNSRASNNGLNDGKTYLLNYWILELLLDKCVKKVSNILSLFLLRELGFLHREIGLLRHENQNQDNEIATLKEIVGFQKQ